MTNNLDHTGCVIDDRLSSLSQPSLIDTLFNRGAALYGAGSIAAAFVALCAILQFNRQKHKDKLAQLSWFQIVLKSAIPGFTFGSEFFLILGMFPTAPRLALTMLFFRLLHFFSALLIVLTITTDDTFHIDFLVRNSTKLASWIDDSFCRENMPFVGGVALLSLCDVTMLQFMPWSCSRFYTESKGWPTLDLLTFCLSAKAVQTMVSVICQITYLVESNSLDSETTSAQAKALFGLNIIVSSLGAIFGLVLLLLKGGFLRQLEAEVDEERGRIKKKKNLLHFFQKLPRKIRSVLGCSENGVTEEGRDASSFASEDLSDMYDDDSDLPGVNTANPLHDPNQGFLERGKVHERDQVIAQKNLLITSLLSAPGALPPGWLFQFTPQGDVYYIDPSGQSSWDHPIIGAIPTLPLTVAGNEGAQPATHGEEANTEDSVGGQEPRNLSIKSIKIEPGKLERGQG